MKRLLFSFVAIFAMIGLFVFADQISDLEKKFGFPKEFADKQLSGVALITQFESLNSFWGVKTMTNNYLCILGDKYCAEAGFVSFLEREKKYHAQNLISLKTYFSKNKLSSEVKYHTTNMITLEYYYGMIATKQFEKAAKLQGGKNIKTIGRYKNNYSKIDGILIGIPGEQWEQEPDNKEEFDKIKKFTSLYTYSSGGTYTFPVIVLEKTKDNKTKNTVYEVTKKIQKAKVIAVSSKLLGSYTTAYIPCQGCKPVIYLYPTTPTDVKVHLDLKGEFTITYPQIPANNTRSVTAQPDGTLVDKQDNKEYSYLFREAKKMKPRHIDEGFVVKKEDYISFLQEKLSYLGLTPKEYNEFIVYRVPLMNKYPYVALRFAGDDYTRQAPLTITPKPDSMQRVFMVFKGLDKPIDLSLQTLTPFKRSGFSVIERGGTEVFH